MTEPKTRSKTLPLYPKQLSILNLLYKFRFGTTELFVQSNESIVSKQFMNRRLRVLFEQGYIGRRYDGSYKLHGKPATYHLLSRGTKLLRDNPERYNAGVLRNIARDKKVEVGEQFIQHNLGVFGAYTRYKHHYGDDLLFATKSNLHGRDNFPKPLPDAYVALKSDKSKHCFLEYFEDSTQFFLTKKRIKYYFEFVEDNDLPKTRAFPGIVFVCESDKLKEQVAKFTTSKFISSWKKIYFEVYSVAELEGRSDLFVFRSE